MTIQRTTEYRLSERRLLKPGIRFTAANGPIFVLKDGSTVSLAAREGYAVVFPSPGDVGPAINRGNVEAAMLRAGKTHAQQTKEASA